MRYILNNSYDPYHNLALEEYIFKGIGQREDFIILWQNQPTVLVGVHQNTIEEINLEYVKKNNINIVRRSTGGGTVYQDLGNLNFSFITSYDENNLIDFKRYTIPVIKALDKLGINTKLSGRNDLTIDNKKFSGNAQSLCKGRILHHGTLLFNSDLEVLSKVLKVEKDKIQSKGIKSVKSRVTNISDYLHKDIDINKFKEFLLENLFEEEDLQEYCLTEKDIKSIKDLKENKYMTWEWNYGKSPKFNLKNSKRFTNGKVEILLNVNKGVIKNCKIYGDFLALTNVNTLEQKIIGLKYQEEELIKLLNSVNLKKYFGNISAQEVLKCFF
ncbi:lipoate--protein ligase [Haloimpatiens sp. FM7330]|uniref:lipoate--protein ligase n=1 Tax=Haloimpatiens sp. FM7330 TaxID=3298610 RepID=UPI003626BE76